MNLTPGVNTMQTPNNTNPSNALTPNPTPQTTTANNTLADPTSTKSELPCPPAGGSYESCAAVEIFLKNFASANGYALSSLDLKARFKKWKCIQGPNQKQILKLVNDPQASIPTCPFSVSGKYVSSNRMWTIIINDPNHDHGPIPNLKPPKLLSLVPSQPKKRKQRSNAIVLDLTYDSEGPDESDNEPVEDYKTLISKLNKLDDNTRRLLMGQFLRDCEIALGICNSAKVHKVQARIEGTDKVEDCTEPPTPEEVEEIGKGETKAKGQDSIETKDLGIDLGNCKVDHATLNIQRDDTQDSSSEKDQDDRYQPYQPEQADSPLTPQPENPSPVTTCTRKVAQPEKRKRSDDISELHPQPRKSVRVTSQTLDNNDQPASKRPKRSEVLKKSGVAPKKPEPKWYFLKILPRILYPFVKSATNVKGNGLCAFASVAVSLGWPKNEAVKVRAMMAAKVQKNYEWYKENLPILSACGTTISQMLEILEFPKGYAPRRLWYPMPGACCVIANTFKRPVISYSSSVTASCTTLPFLSAALGTTRPIILAVIWNSHCISLDLEFTPKLPIPHIHPDWPTLCPPKAKAWESFFADNIEVYRKWRKECNSITHSNSEKHVISDDVEG
ncbi:hypothetical protein DFH28DRAFT_1132990 [Melampsora americana]|nr:hypothetical protein DFH28DRAFT_1132990 [Melampsora americana]